MVTYKISSFCSLGECVEVGQLPGGSVTVRDTKDPERRTALTFTRDESLGTAPTPFLLEPWHRQA